MKRFLGFKHRAAGDEGWKAQTNPLSYGGSYFRQLFNYNFPVQIDLESLWAKRST